MFPERFLNQTFDSDFSNLARHLEPQTRYIQSAEGEVIVDKVIRFEEMGPVIEEISRDIFGGPRKLPHHNKTKSIPIKPKTRARTQLASTIATADFDAFGYLVEDRIAFQVVPFRTTCPYNVESPAQGPDTTFCQTESAPMSVTDRSYVLISPCRNEAEYMRRTLDSVVTQTLTPTRWIIVDDGSTDATPDILADYAKRHDWIEIVPKANRGHRAVGPGVVEAFYVGYDTIDPADFEYSCKLDLDLDLPPRYFETLIERMEADPRIGTCSGKPYVREGSRLVSERRGDEMSVGMTKFYRRACFEDIGGYVREVMWDAIDCHKARKLGWKAVSWDHPDLNFEHLRPMGSSQTSIYTGKRRHGFGQWFMGSDPWFYAATCVFRMRERPYVLGGLAMMQGYLQSWWRGDPQLDDPELRAFIRQYQRKALLKGKSRAVAEIEATQAAAPAR